MAEKRNKSSEDTSDREIVISRTFDAPRKVVWEAWTNPRHVVNWWGPKGFTTTIQEMDVKPGGIWKHVMHGPDGTDYPNRSVFVEVVKPERIIYSHGGGKKGGPGAQFEAIWTFVEQGDKTRVTIRMIFRSATERDQVVKEYGAIEGGKQTLQRLEEYLPRMEAFVISRTFNAPRDLVFKAWIEPAQLAQWWGPKGFTNPVCEIEAKPGGSILIHMRGPDGTVYPMTGVFREINSPERLVFASAVPDGKGGNHLEVINTVTFNEQGGKTTVTVQAKITRSSAQGDIFLEGMEEGWTQSLERLGGYVTKPDHESQKLTPCLWFNDNAEKAVTFYTSIFKNSKMKGITHYGDAGSEASGRPKGSVMTLVFELEAQEFMALNGGPHFNFTPALSFFVWCEKDSEIDNLWGKLSRGGKALMGLDKYPFAEKYGWCEDKFGVSWQLILSNRKQKISPALLFVKEQSGKAEEATKFYTSLFKNSSIESIARDEKTGVVLHARFALAGQDFVAMESPRELPFVFTPAISFIVNCENQQEVDEFWKKLSAEKEAEQCGWLKDQFGVSWQIVPRVLGEMMLTIDSERSERVMKALLNMKKLDIQILKQAAQK